MSAARPTWAKSDWSRPHGHWYTVKVKDAGLAPRACPGESLIFDPKGVPEVGNIVALWFGPVGGADSHCAVGLLTLATRQTIAISTDLAEANPLQFTVTADNALHPAVGVMVPLETVNERNNAVINAALRESLGRNDV